MLLKVITVLAVIAKASAVEVLATAGLGATGASGVAAGLLGSDVFPIDESLLQRPGSKGTYPDPVNLSDRQEALEMQGYPEQAARLALRSQQLNLNQASRVLSSLDETSPVDSSGGPQPMPCTGFQECFSPDREAALKAEAQARRNQQAAEAGVNPNPQPGGFFPKSFLETSDTVASASSGQLRRLQTRIRTTGELARAPVHHYVSDKDVLSDMQPDGFDADRDAELSPQRASAPGSSLLETNAKQMGDEPMALGSSVGVGELTYGSYGQMMFDKMRGRSNTILAPQHAQAPFFDPSVLANANSRPLQLTDPDDAPSFRPAGSMPSLPSGGGWDENELVGANNSTNSNPSGTDIPYQVTHLDPQQLQSLNVGGSDPAASLMRTNQDAAMQDDMARWAQNERSFNQQADPTSNAAVPNSPLNQEPIDPSMFGRQGFFQPGPGAFQPQRIPIPPNFQAGGGAAQQAAPNAQGRASGKIPIVSPDEIGTEANDDLLFLEIASELKGLLDSEAEKKKKHQQAPAYELQSVNGVPTIPWFPNDGAPYSRSEQASIRINREKKFVNKKFLSRVRGQMLLNEPCDKLPTPTPTPTLEPVNDGLPIKRPSPLANKKVLTPDQLNQVQQYIANARDPFFDPTKMKHSCLDCKKNKGSAAKSTPGGGAAPPTIVAAPKL